MPLDANQRAQVAAQIQQDYSATREGVALTKAQLLAAVGATDDWIESNASSFNSALPTAARNNLTTAQKSALFEYVSRKRVTG